MGRAKDQWLEEIGGFRFGESDEQFLARAEMIRKLRAEIATGDGSYEKVSELSRLLGIDGKDD